VQTPIGERLVIPAAGVNAEIWRAAVTTGEMPDPVGYFNAVWYDFSALPGYGGHVSSGNLVLSGHVDCARCHNGGPGTAVFWSARNLKAGDTAQYYTADGRVQNYVVVSSTSYSHEANFAPIVASGAADMTLITCTGTFAGGNYNLRHVVAFKKA
jgi:sortase (surface protein transpeptidase)